MSVKNGQSTLKEFQKEKAKKHKKKRYLPAINIMLVFIIVLCICNFHGLVRVLNLQNYDRVNAEVVRQTKDGLFIIFPKYEVKYSYNNKDYTSTETVLENILFKQRVAKHTTVWVNKLSPKNCLILCNFFSSEVNIICVIVISILLAIVIYSIVYNRKVRALK